MILVALTTQLLCYTLGSLCTRSYVNWEFSWSNNLYNTVLPQLGHPAQHCCVHNASGQRHTMSAVFGSGHRMLGNVLSLFWILCKCLSYTSSQFLTVSAFLSSGLFSWVQIDRGLVTCWVLQRILVSLWKYQWSSRWMQPCCVCLRIVTGSVGTPTCVITCELLDASSQRQVPHHAAESVLSW